MNYIFYQPIPPEELEAELRNFARMVIEDQAGVISRLIISFETTFPEDSRYAAGPDQIHTMHIEGRLAGIRWRRKKPQPSRAKTGAKPWLSGLLEAFQSVADAWSLTGDELARLLGVEGVEALGRLRQVVSSELPVEVLDRIDALSGVHAYADTLLQLPGRAGLWIRTPNHAPLFQGRSPLDVMLAGGFDEIRSVRSYLESAVQ